MLNNRECPRVSVILPIYNQEKYLKFAIQSILNQTYANFELLILDDASTDNSWQIIQSLKDKRIRLFKNTKNLGLSKSLNLLIQKSKGQYIARMDGDDISLPNRLGEQVVLLDQNPEIVLAGSWAKIINNNGQVIGEIKKPVEYLNIRKKILSDNPFIHSSIMFRKKIILEEGAYNQKLIYSQDYDLWLRLVIKYKSVNLPRFLLNFRWDPDFKKQRKQFKTALFIRLKAIREGKFSILEIYKLLIPILFYFCPKFLKEWYWELKFNY